MKKILPMILLLSFSLPTLAVEVKLRCEFSNNINSTKSSEIFMFDEDANTVFNYGGGVCKGTTGNCYRSSIDDSEIWIERFIEGKFVVRRTLDRMTGDYVRETDTGIRDVGKCVPFKKAF